MTILRFHGAAKLLWHNLFISGDGKTVLAVLEYASNKLPRFSPLIYNREKKTIKGLIVLDGKLITNNDLNEAVFLRTVLDIYFPIIGG